jgi:hypothetical protein
MNGLFDNLDEKVVEVLYFDTIEDLHDDFGKLAVRCSGQN